MDIPFSAVDVGFEVKNEAFPSEEKVVVDGFSFPKAIPKPIFLEESSLQFTSDFTEENKRDLVKSLLPSYHTPDHCILIPSSHIPSPESFLSLRVAKPTEITEKLELCQRQLSQLSSNKEACIRRGDTETLKSINSNMNTLWTDIIHLQLQLQVTSDYSQPKLVYLKELHSFVSLLMEYEDHLRTGDSSENYPVEQLKEDITTLQECIETYESGPSEETELQMKKVYYSIRMHYYLV
ncbi:hypothetical protein WA171_001278 [Blastocystis sp. BT1]